MSPFTLSLTQTLPFLPLAQGDIDYEVERRAETGLIESVLAEPATSVILVRDGLLAVPRGQANIVRHSAVKMRLATLPGAYVARELPTHPGAVAMYLGSYGGARNERVVAVDITAVAPVAGVAAGPVDAEFDETMDVRESSGADSASLLESAIDRFDWVDLRGFAPHATAREAGQATTAVCLGRWHETQRHCPACGAPVVASMAGWAQQCTNEADGLRTLFPRIEPAVIATIVDANDRLLIQHNREWNDPALYSVSAGFVEAGENLEHAVRRETFEETGVRVGEVKYLGSQPWPYRASLMMAFKGCARSTDIRVDGTETVAARWVTRDEYTAALADGSIHAPGKATIARYMIEEWLGRQL